MGWRFNLTMVFAHVYAGELVRWVKKLVPRRGLSLEVVKRSDAGKHRFALLPKRWSSSGLLAGFPSSAGTP